MCFLRRYLHANRRLWRGGPARNVHLCCPGSIGRNKEEGLRPREGKSQLHHTQKANARPGGAFLRRLDMQGEIGLRNRGLLIPSRGKPTPQRPCSWHERVR
jgi:hypothetical protein